MIKGRRAPSIGWVGFIVLGLGACVDSQGIGSPEEVPAMPRVGGVIRDTWATPRSAGAIYRSGWLLVIRDAQWPLFWTALGNEARGPLDRTHFAMPIDRELRDRHVNRTVAIRSNGRFDITLTPGDYAFCAADLGDVTPGAEPQTLQGCSEVVRVAAGEAPLVFAWGEEGFVATRRP